MKSVFFVLLLSICQFAVASKVDDMESALAVGDIEGARAKVEAMYKDRKYVMGPEAANLSSYSRLVDIFGALKDVDAKSEKFEQSRLLSDFASLESSYGAFVSKADGKKSFTVSKKTIALLNVKTLDANAKMKSARAIKAEVETAQAEQKAAQAEQERVATEKRVAALAEQRAAFQASQEKRQQEIEAQRIADEKEAAARQKACGKDFETPRVGMSLERAKYCVGDLRLKGQVNRSDGVVSTYWAGKVFLHVMNGKVVSWGDLR